MRLSVALIFIVLSIWKSVATTWRNYYTQDIQSLLEFSGKPDSSVATTVIVGFMWFTFIFFIYFSKVKHNYITLFPHPFPPSNPSNADPTILSQIGILSFFNCYYIYMYIFPKYVNTTHCLVHIMLLICMWFQGLPFGVRKPVWGLFPEEDYFSYCQHSLFACRFLIHVIMFIGAIPCSHLV